jgi:two-component system, cell cycle sensor histidine kinase and response regulator CckA
MSVQVTEAGVGIIPPAPADYRARITAIRDSLGGPRVEMIGRFLLPGLGVALISILTADLVVALIYLFFLLTQAMLFGFLATRKAICSRAEYIMALVLAGLTSAAFVAIGMYMWSTGILISQFAAYCMVQGFATYVLTRSSTMIELMILDTVPILIGALYATNSLAQKMADQVHPAVTFAIALLILIYYVVSLYNVFDTKIKLRRAEDRAIAAERLEAVGHLTGGLAHDFNNILTAVLGHLDLYSHLTNPTEKNDCVAAAHQSATRAAKLTAQLLFFARKARITAVATDLTDFLTEFAESARSMLPEGAVLHTDLPVNLPLVSVDRDKLGSVLQQLTLNARDALDQAGQLTLALDHFHEPVGRKMQGDTSLTPGSYCVISLADTGAGIRPEHLPHIFEPFYTTKPKGHASGLGLSMAAGFAELSGGAIAVNSAPKAGTTVQLYLPSLGRT